jgi:hypothetical protein
MLKWALQQGLAQSTSICEGAAVAGRLEFLRWLREVMKLPSALGRMQFAACKRGDLQLLRWVCSADSTPTLAEGCALECVAAVGASGSINTLAWLQLNHCFSMNDGLHSHAYAGAIAAGNLDSVRYLFGYNYSLDEECIAQAAQHGHAALVAFLHTTAEYSLYDPNGLACGLAAARRGSVAVLAYMQPHAPDKFSNVTALKDMLYCCMRLNHLAAAKWLREQGAQWPDKLWFFDESDDYGDGETDLVQTCSLEVL